jgi:hypothetical protein
MIGRVSAARFIDERKTSTTDTSRARGGSPSSCSLDGEQISAITAFTDTSVFARFGLPRTLPAQRLTRGLTTGPHPVRSRI